MRVKKSLENVIRFIVCVMICFTVIETLPCKFFVKAESGSVSEVDGLTAEEEKTFGVQDVVEYNSEDFSVTEDYSAYVDSARLLHQTGGNANTILDGNRVVLYGEEGMVKTQLDSGKSGLLLTSKASGDDAVGKSFDIAGVQSGDFSLNFRVFSKKTFRGYEAIKSGAGNSGNGTTYDDTFNPFLDMRTVGITFTSVTDPTKAFTGYVDGATNSFGTTTSARVAIQGEAYKWWGREGYGLYDENGYSTYYNLNTVLENTSFSNVSRSAESFSNVIRFDVEKMCVYGRSYTFASIAGYGNGYYYQETDKLIRNLATNNYKDDNSGGVFVNDHLGTLSKEDFLFGYTVSVSIEDMTADDVPATAPSAASDTESPDENAVLSATDTGDTYERFANIILYDVNGQDMRKYEPFTAQPQAYTFSAPAGKDIPMNNQKVTGLRLTSSAKNQNAEGNSFGIDGSVFKQSDGTYMLAVSAIPTHYATSAAANMLNGYDYGGLGNKNAAADPYSDVREIGITFRSKKDATKAFTVYLSSSDLKRNAMSARVGVEGERYRNESGAKGFGLRTVNNNPTFNGDNQLYTQTAGTMGMMNNTSSDSYNTTTNPYAWVKFNPQDMTVSTFDYDWKVVRYLSEDISTTDWLAKELNQHIVKLEKDDFDDFGVEISIERMNTKENRGLAMSQYCYYDGTGTKQAYTGGYTDSNGDGYILDAGYDRQAVIDVLTTTVDGTNTINEDEVSFAGTGYREKSRFAFDGYTFTWKETLTLGLSASEDISSLTYSHLEKDETGSAVIDGGKISFNPKNLGIYKFTGAGDFNVYIKLESEPPKLTLNTEATKTIYVGDEFSVSSENLTVESNWKTVVDIECLFNGLPVELNGAVNAAQSGVYEIIYKVTDEDGKSATVKQTVTVLTKDTEAPVISWADMPAQSLVSKPIDLKGISAMDTVDGRVELKIVKVVLSSNGVETELTVTDGVVVPASDGEIIVYAEAADAMGNKAEKTYRIAVNAVEQDIIDSEHNETEDNSGVSVVPVKSNNKTGLIVGLSVGGGIAVVAGGVGAWLFAVKRKHRIK